jgi:hypothetical protein
MCDSTVMRSVCGPRRSVANVGGSATLLLPGIAGLREPPGADTTQAGRAAAGLTPHGGTSTHRVRLLVRRPAEAEVAGEAEAAAELVQGSARESVA